MLEAIIFLSAFNTNQAKIAEVFPIISYLDEIQWTAKLFYSILFQDLLDIHDCFGDHNMTLVTSDKQPTDCKFPDWLVLSVKDYL